MEKDSLLTNDVFWMALIKAFCNKEPDKYNSVLVRENKNKIQAVYLNREGLPFLSQAKIMFDDREISMNDFRFAYFEMKDRIHQVLKEIKHDTGSQEEQSNPDNQEIKQDSDSQQQIE